MSNIREHKFKIGERIYLKSENLSNSPHDYWVIGINYSGGNGSSYESFCWLYRLVRGSADSFKRVEDENSEAWTEESKILTRGEWLKERLVFARKAVETHKLALERSLQEVDRLVKLKEKNDTMA